MPFDSNNKPDSKTKPDATATQGATANLPGKTDPNGLNTLPIIEKIISQKQIAPLANIFLGHRVLGPITKKALDREIVTYLFFGVLSTIVGFVSYMACFSLFMMSALISNIISSAIAILFAFVVNKHFVFLSKDWSLRVALRELGQFAGGRVLVSGGETLLLGLLVDHLGFNGGLCKILTLTLVMVANYILSKLIF
jgi:putative flippase GtrA